MDACSLTVSTLWMFPFSHSCLVLPYQWSTWQMLFLTYCTGRFWKIFWNSYSFCRCVLLRLLTIFWQDCFAEMFQIQSKTHLTLMTHVKGFFWGVLFLGNGEFRHAAPSSSHHHLYIFRLGPLLLCSDISVGAMATEGFSASLFTEFLLPQV